MSDLEELKTRVRKLSTRATQAKMDLHDLSEELPLRWEEIPAVAAATHEIFRQLQEAKVALEAAKKQ